MSAIAKEILELLNDDMVSHGLFVQCVQQGMNASNESFDSAASAVLEELLTSGQVEIGEAKLVEANYVEFVAWGGTVHERLSKAKEKVERTTKPDKEFAYWLSLRKNVDRFEEHVSLAICS
jgi:hypothetical protein